jgi:hypothetical protein
MEEPAQMINHTSLMVPWVIAMGRKTELNTGRISLNSH